MSDQRFSGKDLQADDAFHPETKADGIVSGFWSVVGSALAPRYTVVLLGRTRTGRPRTATFWGTSAVGLANEMEKAGWLPLHPADVARLCESAGSSQRIVRDKQFIRETDFQAAPTDSPQREGEAYEEEGK